MSGSADVSPLAHREIELAELLALLWRGRWLLAAMLAGTLAAGALYCLLAPPVYQADALVQVETDDKAGNPLLGDLAEIFGGQAPVAAELEILRSRLVQVEAIDKLGLEIVAEPRRLPVIGAALARWRGDARALALVQLEVPPDLREEWLTLRATPVGFELLDADGEVVAGGAPGEPREGRTPAGRFAVTVRELRAAPGDEFRVMRRDPDELLADIGERLDIAELGKQSGVIGITYEDRDRERAAAFVNALVDAHLRQNVARRSAEAEQSLAFLATQLPKVREGVESAEAALNRFRLRQGSADLGKETELILQQSVALEAQRVQVDQSREGLLQRYTAEHPAIQALEAQRRDLQREQAAMGERVKRLPETQQDLLRLMRDVQVNEQIYTQLLNSAQELQLARAGTIGNVRIIDHARPRWRPARPLPGLVMGLSAVLGLALGLLGVFLRHALRDGVEDPAEVERALGLPTYATVPYSRAQRRLARAGGARLLALADPGEPAIEALRSLRTSLHFAAGDSRNNVLVLTGPTPGLGKSFLAVNLGAVLATAKKSVVLVDADLRRGRLHEHLGLARGPGLADWVAGESDVEKIARATPVPGLAVVTTGPLPGSPSELLLHERLAQLLAELSRRFDHVIVDTPPVLAVTDAAIVGRLAGAALLVLKSGTHSLRQVSDSLTRLRQAGVEVKGSIFNQAGLRGADYRYRYTYEYRSISPPAQRGVS